MRAILIGSLCLMLAGCGPAAQIFINAAVKTAVEGGLAADQAARKKLYMENLAVSNEHPLAVSANAEGVSCERLAPLAETQESDQPVEAIVQVNTRTFVNAYRCEADGYLPYEFKLLGLKVVASGHLDLPDLTVYRVVTPEPLEVVLIPERFDAAAERARLQEARESSYRARFSAWQKAYKARYDCGFDNTDGVCAEFRILVRDIRLEERNARDSDIASAEVQQ